MMITLELDTVDLAQIAASGQCFRMAPLEEGRWLVPMGRWMAMARQRDARRIELSADGEDGTFLDAARRYFDADTDYLTAIRAIDPSDAYLSAAAEAGRGIRILRQRFLKRSSALLSAKTTTYRASAPSSPSSAAARTSPFPSQSSLLRGRRMSFAPSGWAIVRRMFTARQSVLMKARKRVCLKWIMKPPRRT